MKHDAENTKPCKVYVNGYELDEVVSFDDETGLVEVCTTQMLDEELLNAEVKARSIIVEYLDAPGEYRMVYPESRKAPEANEILSLSPKRGPVFHIKGAVHDPLRNIRSKLLGYVRAGLDREMQS